MIYFLSAYFSFAPIWTQVTTQGFAVRSITQDNSCPAPMTLRASPSADFPVTVCELELPHNTSQAGPIAIIGDTGCHKKQDCNDNTQWPLKTILDNIASAKPSLIIHVGDYVYRQDYNWATWKADFFDPAASMLSQTPWLFMRGNHELCDRGGQGWFRFFDPRPYTETCSDYTDPYTVNYAGLNLLVMDNAAVTDSPDPADENSAQIYAKQFETARDWKADWLLIHEPIWGVVPNKKKPKIMNPTLQEAFKSAPAGIQFVLSGHIHLSQTLNFKDNLPAQMITGMGGTRLDKELGDTSDIKFQDRHGLKIHSLSQFGHMLVSPTSTGAVFEQRGLDNQVIQRFVLQGNQLHRDKHEEL
ncbi:MAG: metallophosphoesterase [Myxococcaceae bacterium]